MPWQRMIWVVINCMLLGCSTDSRTHLTSDHVAPRCVEEFEHQTFLGNCKRLRESNGFRQNVWLSYHQGSIGAICMDLDHQLYLVIHTKFPLRSEEYLSNQFRSLRISANTLRNRMDPDAFILDRDGINWISRIPLNAEESFPCDLFHELCGVNLRSSEIRFSWD